MQPENFKNVFQQLLLNSPRYNLKQVQVENCDYADTAVKSKNVYYSFGTFYCEDVCYARYCRKCSDCYDITLCVSCQYCVRCTDCAQGYGLTDCRDCYSCVECEYCEDCHSCNNCFGCIGLHRAQYCIFNRSVSREDYQQFLSVQRPQLTPLMLEKQLEQLRRIALRPAIHQFRCEDTTGNYLSECSNCYHCYDSFALEDCYYCIETNGNKNCCDLTVCFEAELCYSCVHSPFNYNCNFLLHTDRSSDSEFCAYSRNLKNCFGCVNLSNAQYCILNRSVGAEAYSLITQHIKQYLIKTNSYNLELYFLSEYETNRRRQENESPLQILEEVS